MYLLFDIGATKMRLAISPDAKTFGEPLVVATPHETAEVMAVFKSSAEQLLAGAMPLAIAGGVTHKHEAAKAEIAKTFTCPSYIENDAAVVGLGELSTGAARGASIAVYMTISTGVGGVRLVDGRIDRSASGFEPGHQYIHAPMKVGDHVKTLEQAVGGRALSEEWGKSVVEVTDPAVWEDLARILAYGLHNTLMHWSPEVLVLGGSMITGTPAISLDSIKKHLAEISHIFPTLPTIKQSELGDFGGLHGGLHLLQSRLMA
jgi:predicted NBD/HSP70 family sugar kinase